MMTTSKPHVKSPFLAGVFGIFPGFGHLYAGILGKSFVLAALLFFMLQFCLPLGSLFGFHFIFQHQSSEVIVQENAVTTLNQYSFNYISLLFLASVALVSSAIFYLSKPKCQFCMLFIIFLFGLFNIEILIAMAKNFNHYTFYIISSLQNVNLTQSFVNPFQSTSLAVLVLCLTVPLIILYSIADAVVSVIHHNRRVMFGGGDDQMASHTKHEPPTGYWSGNVEQETLRQAAREHGMPV